LDFIIKSSHLNKYNSWKYGYNEREEHSQLTKGGIMAGINLADLFKYASSALNKEKDTLNAEDKINHDHGDNMAETFSVITQAMKEKSSEPAWQQLAYASELLKQKSQSGSGTLYASALEKASSLFKGKNINASNIIPLIQTILGGGQKTQTLPLPQGTSSKGNLLGTLTSLLGSSGGGGGNLLGSLLGGLGNLTGGGSSQGSSGGGLLGGLLGGGGQKSGGSSGMDLGNLLSAGASLLGGGQQSSPLGILSGFVSGSPLGQTTTRAASGMLVANSLIQGAAKLLGKKKTASKAKKPTTRKTATKKTAVKKTTAKKTAKKKKTTR
jgi:hypothetical protein